LKKKKKIRGRAARRGKAHPCRGRVRGLQIIWEGILGNAQRETLKCLGIEGKTKITMKQAKERILKGCQYSWEVARGV